MQLLDDYLNAKDNLFDYFGYVVGWTNLTIHDDRSYEWMIVDNQVVLSSVINADAIREGAITSFEVVKNSLSRRDDYTMIHIDAGVLEGRALSVFSNALEKTQEDLKELYNEYWG